MAQLSDAELRKLHVSTRATQAQLHALVAALYCRDIELSPATVEVMLQTADFLGMQCIFDACESYLLDHVVAHHHREVSSVSAPTILKPQP